VVHSKLRAVAAALTAYQWQFGLLPPEPASTESPGGQGLSWRVHILPLLGEFALYERFRMDEPWDSPHNRELLDSMPDIYRFDSADTRRTRIRGFTEPGLIFGPAPKVPTDHINALMAVAVGKEEGVVWTQPSDYPPRAGNGDTDPPKPGRWGVGGNLRLQREQVSLAAGRSSRSNAGSSDFAGRPREAARGKADTLRRGAEYSRADACFAPRSFIALPGTRRKARASGQSPPWNSNSSVVFSLPAKTP
jgi:hypothetical protein